LSRSPLSAGTRSSQVSYTQENAILIPSSDIRHFSRRQSRRVSCWLLYVAPRRFHRGYQTDPGKSNVSVNPSSHGQERSEGPCYSYRVLDCQTMRSRPPASTGCFCNPRYAMQYKCTISQVSELTPLVGSIFSSQYELWEERTHPERQAGYPGANRETIIRTHQF
jgi:hypothetical protein